MLNPTHVLPALRLKEVWLRNTKLAFDKDYSNHSQTH
jgi:hypothetical protein